MEYDREMLNELMKCKDDVVYFAENYFTHTGLNGIGILPLYEAQKRVLRGMAFNRNIVNLGARQTGLTSLNSIYALWEAMFCNDRNIVIMSHKQESAKHILERIRFAYEKLPNWLKSEVIKFTSREMTFSNFSSIEIISASASACRGMYPNTLIIDNAAFIPPRVMDEIWNSLYPVVSSSKNSKIILSSCPNGKGNLFANIYEKSKKANNDWWMDRLKWHDVPGRNRKWKHNMIKCIGKEAFKSEFLCEFI